MTSVRSGFLFKKGGILYGYYGSAGIKFGA